MPKQPSRRPSKDQGGPYKKPAPEGRSQKQAPQNVSAALSRIENGRAGVEKPAKHAKPASHSRTIDEDEVQSIVQSLMSHTSRPVLQDKSVNAGSTVPYYFSNSKLPTYTKAGKTSGKKKDNSEEYVPMAYQTRLRILKNKRHYVGPSGLWWDSDLEALAEEDRMTANHSIIPIDVVEELAEEGDDDATIIAKLKAAGKNFWDFNLRGEFDKSQPIYDTCVRLKEKITAFLGEKDAMDKGMFAIRLGVSTASLRNFMKKEGVMGGAENGTYVAAYCFFEKKRMWEGAEKSEARTACEAVWWPKGLQRRDSSRKDSYIVPVDFVGDLYEEMDSDTGETFTGTTPW